MVPFLLACITCRFFSALVYSIPFIFLLGIKFILFVGLSLAGALIWFQVGGAGLTLDSLDLSNVY